MNAFFDGLSRVWGRVVHEINHMELAMALWLGLALLTIALLILMATRWGQVKPVWKCVALSMLAHVLLCGYAYGTRLIFRIPTVSQGEPIELKLVEAEPDSANSRTRENVAQPWDQFEFDASETPPISAAERLTADIRTPVTRTTMEQDSSVTTPRIAGSMPQHNLAQVESEATQAIPINTDAHQIGPQRPPAEALQITRQKKAETEPFVAPETESLARLESADSQIPHPIADKTVEQRDQSPEDLDSLIRPTVQMAKLASPPRIDSKLKSSSAPAKTVSDSELEWGTSRPDAAELTPATSRRRLADGKPMPDLYSRRSFEQRLPAALQFGGDRRTEEAVDSALQWLAQNQEADGRWSAARFGAGRETRVLGHDRKGAGANADTGITALGLLAFLGAGHSHFEGTYKESVQRGLEFLLNQQSANGSMAGNAQLFAQMYCHGMATLAVSEALATTGDRRLVPSVRSAVQYSANAQNSVDGGWRYQSGDRGDMSQFGWQVMALNSAELGGVQVPDRTKALMKHFLHRASSGSAGGLAGYRPGHAPTATMTAEALLCRHLINDQISDDVTREASQMILRQRPGQSEFNLYYWYYATLALFLTGGDDWEAWNQSLTTTLLDSQTRQGAEAGSWPPNGVWCGYGGRIYSTAMAALCLEVYYRYSR